MIDFQEARIYGKWFFGDKFKRATETDDGWLFFLDKDGNSLGEEQTWDEFERTWKRENELCPEFKAFVAKERKAAAKRRK